MKKVSIIIPVYNVEKYLRRCLDSVLAQTYTNFEAILVDNCSSDSSVEICEEYAQKDSRVRVFKNEKNMGLSFSRNRGLDESNGDYIAFVDSDDYIIQEYLETLVTTIEKYQCDIVQCGFYHVLNNEIQLKDQLEEKNETCTEYGQEEAYSLLYGVGDCNILNFMVWNKLYKRERIAGIRFSSLRCEDAIFVSKTIMNSQKVVASTKPIYYYCRHEDSVMGVMQKDIKKMVYSHLLAYRQVVEDAMASTAVIKDLSCARLATYYVSAIKRKMLIENRDLREMLKEDKKRFSLHKNKRVPFIKRVILTLWG